MISNHSDTMQQATFVMMFFMVILILLSGLFTPISSMPQWAQGITILNPLKYLMQVMRLVYLKGSPFSQLTVQFADQDAKCIHFNLQNIKSLNTQKARILQCGLLLTYLDSNQERQIQNL